MYVECIGAVDSCRTERWGNDSWGGDEVRQPGGASKQMRVVCIHYIQVFVRQNIFFDWGNGQKAEHYWCFSDRLCEITTVYTDDDTLWNNVDSHKTPGHVIASNCTCIAATALCARSAIHRYISTFTTLGDSVELLPIEQVITDTRGRLFRGHFLDLQTRPRIITIGILKLYKERDRISNDSG